MANSKKIPPRPANNKFADMLLSSVEWFIRSLIVGLFAFVWSINSQMVGISSSIDRHGSEIATIKADIVSLRNSTVTKSELLETMKRVEQQMEIIVLRKKLEQSG